MKLITNLTVGHPRKLLKPFLLTVLSNLLNIVPFGLVLRGVYLIFEGLSSPEATLDIRGLWWVCAALGAYMIVIFLGEIPPYRASYRGAYEVAAEGRIHLAEHLRKLPLGFLLGRDPGDLANMMMGDFALLEQGISHIAPQLAGALVAPIIALLGLSFLDWRMALALFMPLPVGVFLLGITAGIMRIKGLRHMRIKIDAANRLQEYLNGIRVVKAYNLVGPRFARLEKAFRDFMKESIRLEAIGGSIILPIIACIRTGLTIMIVTGSYLLLEGTLSPFVFLAFLLVGSRIFDPLTAALINFALLRYFELAGERILALQSEPVMRGNANPPEEGDITFEKVTFHYHSKEEPALRNISLQVPRGSLTALVGPSGSGKSTLLKLIPRFYDPQEGQILLGGKKLAHMEPEGLLRKVSMVFQEVYLFQDTLGNNIRFGKEGASQKEVEEAARKACCHDFIMKLPQGYDTPVGEGGCTLSGGEKQRISIARAFLKNAPIVLLDEATASLDPENELEVQRAIDTLIEGRTVVVVAHRLKTIRRADTIVVLENGEMVEQGTHEELLKRDGRYKDLWNIQQQSAGWSLAS
ncbi:MAG TPA: ABC transporter ATP-binding protein [Synergistaceae bacterium]|nr:ABC transporter ATP-binding protein [Synergistaceae bacterium]HPQ37369.1 ABC transporter ATP-binding protein [Synergistaceae bacterium]